MQTHHGLKSVKHELLVVVFVKIQQINYIITLKVLAKTMKNLLEWLYM